MPRVTAVKKAQKAQGQCGKCGAKIKVGDSYRWWKFRYGGRRVRCGKPSCAPRASDLTQSPFYASLYDIEDGITDAIGTGDKSAIADALRNAAEELRSLGEECQEKRDNMPEQLQDSETGELLQTRADECEEKAEELERQADEVENAETTEPDDWENYASENGLERADDETDEDFEQRVRDEIEAENESLLNVEIDLGIS